MVFMIVSRSGKPHRRLEKRQPLITRIHNSILLTVSMNPFRKVYTNLLLHRICEMKI